MRAVVQRVLSASVRVEGALRGSVEGGLLVYLGVARGDRAEDAGWLAEKIASLRIFPDGEDKMNRSVLDTGGGVLAVSQFTLLADARKGRRPSYAEAEEAEAARTLYEHFMEQIRALGLPCSGGVFRSRMEVASVNDGPVTILLDSHKLF